MPRVTALDVRADLETHPWTELQGQQYVPGEVISVGLLADGTDGGLAVVAVLIRTQNRYVVAQTTLRLARNAVGFLANTDIVRNEQESGQ